jgi:hypothetical protein
VRSGFAADRSGAWVWVVMGCVEAGAEASGADVERLVALAHDVARERVRYARAGSAAAFERRQGFVPEAEGAEALPARASGSMLGASRIPALASAREGESVALLGLARIDDALAIAEDVGPRGRVEVDEQRSETLRLLALEAEGRGLENVVAAHRIGALPDWRTPLATLAVHAPGSADRAEERAAAMDALLAALAPGGIAVLWLDGAAVPAADAARREMLGGWMEAARAIGLERGRLWRWPRGESFALEFRRPLAR